MSTVKGEKAYALDDTGYHAGDAGAYRDPYAQDPFAPTPARKYSQRNPTIGDSRDPHPLSRGFTNRSRRTEEPNQYYAEEVSYASPPHQGPFYSGERDIGASYMIVSHDFEQRRSIRWTARSRNNTLQRTSAARIAGRL